MINKNKKKLVREKRKIRIKWGIKRVSINPRLTVFKSAKHIYAQIVDDDKNITLAASSTLSKDLKDKMPTAKGKIEVSKEVGKLVGKLALKKGIEKVTFDRNGFLYHGRVAALADGAREAGLKF